MYSTAGFGFLLNLPGDGSVAVNSSGAIDWDVVAQKQMDFWITTTPAAAPVYKQYADAVGHAPPLPGYAALFWQCRLRYRTQQILEDIALGYHQRNLSLGVIVVDFMNQKRDGDFHMNPVCFPNISSMTARVKSLTGAQTMVSFWPDVKPDGDAAATLSAEGSSTLERLILRHRSAAISYGASTFSPTMSTRVSQTIGWTRTICTLWRRFSRAKPNARPAKRTCSAQSITVNRQRFENQSDWNSHWF